MPNVPTTIVKPNYLAWFVRVFITGVLAILPLAATLLILGVLGGMIYDWLGPNSFFGRAIASLGYGFGMDAMVLRYLIGVAILLLLIFGLGLLTERGLQKGMHKLIDSIILKIPIVRTIYETVGHFVEMLTKKKGKDLRGMSPVWCSFGSESGVILLALLSCPDLIKIEDQEYYSVIIPTAPVPIGGAVLFVPREWVKPALINIEDLTSIYVSMGATSPQILNSTFRKRTL